MKKRAKTEYSLTEEDVQRLYLIARKLSNKFRFGYFDRDDIVQECMILALKALPDYDGKRSLYNFLYTHMVNRLINLIRDKKERIVPPCINCHKGHFCATDKPCKKYFAWLKRNTSKRSLTSPQSISGESLYAKREISDEKIYLGELKEYVEGKLNLSERKLWLMYLDGVKLKKNDFLFLKRVITKILEEKNGKTEI